MKLSATFSRARPGQGSGLGLRVLGCTVSEASRLVLIRIEFCELMVSIQVSRAGCFRWVFRALELAGLVAFPRSSD